METLENRTREGAGVVSRMWRTLCEAVRSSDPAPQEQVKESFMEKVTRLFLESPQVRLVKDVPEQVKCRHLVVKYHDGKGTVVFDAKDELLEKKDYPEAKYAGTLFSVLERSVRSSCPEKRLNGVRLELVLADGQWKLATLPTLEQMVLSDAPAERKLKKIEGGMDCAA